jgi:hypothetical protein
MIPSKRPPVSLLSFAGLKLRDSDRAPALPNARYSSDEVADERSEFLFLLSPDPKRAELMSLTVAIGQQRID